MRVIVSQVIVLCAVRVLGQYLISSKLCASSPVSIYALGALGQVHSAQCHIHSAVSRSTMPCPYVVRLPSTGKLQVLLCAATFKFRGHLSIAFSWSLAFSRPKNGPDRIAGRSRTAKTIFHRSLRHTTSCERRHQVLDSPLAPLSHTFKVGTPFAYAFALLILAIYAVPCSRQCSAYISTTLDSALAPLLCRQSPRISPLPLRAHVSIWTGGHRQLYSIHSPLAK